MSKEKFTEPWFEFAKTWKKTYPPARPSQKNIADYEKFLREVVKSNKKGVKILLLGATPELRDLFAECENIQVTLVDVNMDMILAMTELMKKKTENEIWIKSDWLTVPLSNNYYDLVFGDYVTGNLPRKKLASLFGKIRTVLKPGGYFITRFFSYLDPEKVFDFDSFILKMSKKKITDRLINDLWCVGVFCFGGEDKNGDKIVSTDRLFQGMEKLALKDKRVAKLYEAALKIIPRHKYWSYGHSWTDDKRLIEKYFVIEKSAPDNYLPIYKYFSRIYKLKAKT